MSKDLSISKSVIRKVYYEMYVLCSIGIKVKKKIKKIKNKLREVE